MRALNFVQQEQDWQCTISKHYASLIALILFGKRCQDNSLETYSELSVFCSRIKT